MIGMNDQVQAQQAQAVRQQPVEQEQFGELENMYMQVKDLDVGLLLSGLTILAKDTATYLTASGVDNDMAEAFQLAHLDMLSTNRDYWERFGPDLYRSLRDAKLPDGFASGAAQCDVNLVALTDCFWEKQEWLKAPGWHFFKTYSAQRRGDIFRDIVLETPSGPRQEEAVTETPLEALKRAFCEGKSPYLSESGNPTQQAYEESDPFHPVEALVKRLAEEKRYWYPVMLYLVLLIYKTDFQTLEDATSG